MNMPDFISPETSKDNDKQFWRSVRVKAFWSFFSPKKYRNRSLPDIIRLKLTTIFCMLCDREDEIGMTLADREEEGARKEGREPNYNQSFGRLVRWGLGVKLYNRIYEAADLYANDKLTKRGLNRELSKGIHFAYKATYCLFKILERKLLRRTSFDKYLSPELRLAPLK